MAPSVTDLVGFVDSDGKMHRALVTAVFPQGEPPSEGKEPTEPPLLNLVYVKPDGTVVGPTSIGHASRTRAGVHCWKAPGES